MSLQIGRLHEEFSLFEHVCAICLGSKCPVRWGGRCTPLPVRWTSFVVGHDTRLKKASEKSSYTGMHTETSAVWDPTWKGAPLFDPATNLRSGAAVMDALRRELSRAARFCPDVAVVALALRPAGLEARDEMLRRAGCICARSVRDYDPIGRIGPAELLLVFPDCRLDEGHRIATRLKTNIVSSMGLASVWAGVSATGAGVSDALELVQAALSNLGVARLSETAALGQPSSWSLAPRVSDRSVGAS